MGRVKFSDILDAFEFVSFGPPTEHAAYLSKETGAIYWHSEVGDNFEELPPDIDEEGKYLSIPHKNDLGLGKRLAIEFAEDFLADDVGKVREIFSRRGAYARFKDLLEHRGMLNRWYEFEASAQKEALLQWCRDNGVEVDGWQRVVDRRLQLASLRIQRGADKTRMLNGLIGARAQVNAASKRLTPASLEVCA